MLPRRAAQKGELLGTPGSLDSYGFGNAADNVLVGNSGRNVLWGGGNDVLLGGEGRGILNGGDGDDVLMGLLNNDGLTGGAGRDVFWIDGAGPATSDLIIDFSPGEHLVVLDSNAFAALSPGGLLAENFVAGPGVVASGPGHLVLYDTASSELLYDGDGRGAGAAARMVRVGHHPLLSESDIFID